MVSWVRLAAFDQDMGGVPDIVERFPANESGFAIIGIRRRAGGRETAAWSSSG
jgi:hypothetical protein